MRTSESDMTDRYKETGRKKEEIKINLRKWDPSKGRELKNQEVTRDARDRPERD